MLRNYYYKNILSFGDLIHRIHPLAGQGFNMTIRDIKILSQIIEEKINLGLEIDNSVGVNFEKKTKHLNFIYGSGVDLIYKFFNLDDKFLAFALLINWSKLPFLSTVLTPALDAVNFKLLFNIILLNLTFLRLGKNLLFVLLLA